MEYDSTCRVSFTYTDVKRNGTKLRLANWARGRYVNADNSVLAFQSASDTFTVHTGDTISFYRELSWINPKTGHKDTNTYYALDTLDFAVELVRQSNFTRVALLDSLGVLPRTTVGRPVVYGFRPLLAVVTYIVPSSLNNMKVFLRPLMSHRGSGNYWFSRSDGITLNLSNRVNLAVFQQWISLFAGALPKYTPDAFSRIEGTQGNLDVRLVPNSEREIVIDFTPLFEGPVSIAIYDMSGRLVFQPYVSPSSQGTASARYQFADKGMYFVVLMNGNQAVRSRKVIIN